MRPRDTRPRVLGPYADGAGWRIVAIEGGRRTAKTLATKAQAEAVRREIEAELAKVHALSKDQALERYAEHLTAKGNKSGSVAGTIGKLRTMLEGLDDLAQLTPRRAAAIYLRLRTRISPRTGKPLSPDSHRNMLAEAKTFGRWCAKQRLLPADPFAAIEGVGRRSHGKAQLRIDEARRWTREAFALADRGDQGAVAALISLLLGLRAGEIVAIAARDIDDGGRILWIPDSKTAAGRRQIEIPAPLRRYLAELARACKPTDRIFGAHWRDWPRAQVRRVCQLAHVPTVCAHAMRGLHSTLAIQAGASSHLVAAALGHENHSVTLRSYARPGTVETQRSAQVQARLADVLPLRAEG